jgi:hypothetical protein
MDFESSIDALPAEKNGSTTPRATFKERPWAGRVLPPMHDPSRPSTGQAGRIRTPATRMSAGDFNSAMEKMLCQARQSRQDYVRPSTAAAYMGNVQM